MRDRDLEYLASKTERKLDGQIQEFSKLRDRVLLAAGYSIALLTAIFSYWVNLSQLYSDILTGGIILSFISIAVLIYSAFSTPLNRGMNTSAIEEIIEKEDQEEDFLLTEIAYNLDSFKDNQPILRRLQRRLNWCLTAQAAVTVLTGVSLYLNNLNNG